MAQVHPGTVSRALNLQTRALVNEETAERVLRAAEELGYQPNRIARGLLTEIAAGIPLVLVNRSLEDGSVPAVTVNDHQGIRLAVEHVAGLGHTKIGHLAGPQNVSTGHRRHLGFMEAMRTARLKVGR